MPSSETQTEAGAAVMPFPGRSRMSEELLATLRRRIQDRYYDQPHVIEIIAQAILHSRGLYL